MHEVGQWSGLWHTSVVAAAGIRLVLWHLWRPAPSNTVAPLVVTLTQSLALSLPTAWTTTPTTSS